MTASIVVKSIIYNPNINKVLILKRSGTDDIGADTWENAGGNIEFGEKPEEAIVREIREETGINDIDIKRIAYVTFLNSEKNVLIIVYLCETKTEIVKLSREHQAYLWADEYECRNKLPKEITYDFENNNIFTLLSNS